MPRRRSFFNRLFSRFRPKTERRRGSRDSGEGRREGQEAINPNAPRFGALQPFGAEQPFGPDPSRREREDAREIYNDLEGQGGFNNAYEYFNSLPAVYENEEERQQVWASFVRYMLSGDLIRQDPSNPFWSDIGMRPRDFDWAGWRAVMATRGS